MEADAHALAEALELLLEHLVAEEELLDGLIALPLTPELVELGLQALNVLLGPRPDGPLGLPVVGPLAGELGWCQGRDAASAYGPVSFTPWPRR